LSVSERSFREKIKLKIAEKRNLMRGIENDENDD